MVRNVHGCQTGMADFVIFIGRQFNGTLLYW